MFALPPSSLTSRCARVRTIIGLGFGCYNFKHEIFRRPFPAGGSRTFLSGRYFGAGLDTNTGANEKLAGARHVSRRQQVGRGDVCQRRFYFDATWISNNAPLLG